MVTWVKLRDRQQESRPPLAFFNTHFDHQGPTARRESARLLRRKIGDSGKNCAVIVTGDFNTDQDTPPYQALFGPDAEQLSPIVDSYRTAHPDKEARRGNVFRIPGLRDQRSADRLDWRVPRLAGHVRSHRSYCPGRPYAVGSFSRHRRLAAAAMTSTEESHSQHTLHLGLLRYDTALDSTPVNRYERPSSKTLAVTSRCPWEPVVGRSESTAPRRSWRGRGTASRQCSCRSGLSGIPSGTDPRSHPHCQRN